LTQATTLPQNLNSSSEGKSDMEIVKDIFAKVTSLKNEEVDVIRALVDLSRGLKN
jgi:hypothetical protein